MKPWKKLTTLERAAIHSLAWGLGDMTTQQRLDALTHMRTAIQPYVYWYIKVMMLPDNPIAVDILPALYCVIDRSTHEYLRG